MKKYYKVLGPNLTSFNQQRLDMPNSLQYKEHEWTFAPSGKPLFIFDTLDHAQNFIKNYTDCGPRIFECEVEGQKVESEVKVLRPATQQKIYLDKR